MLRFRSELSKIEKIFVPRSILWLLILCLFLAGYFFEALNLIKFDGLAFSVVSVIVLVSFIPLFFLRTDRKKNFYYGVVLAFLDPMCVSTLLGFADSYHHIFLFLYVLSLLFSGFLLNRMGALFLTAFTSILFLGVTGFSEALVSGLFRVTVVLLFFVFTLSLTGLKDYFRVVIRHLRIKDKDISALEFFNMYLIDNMQNGLIAVDEELRVSFWNKAAAAILGKEYKDICGKDLHDIYSVFCRYCSKSSSDHIEVWEKFGGRNKCLMIKVSPIHVEKEFIGNMIVFEDITNFKESQRINEQNLRLAAIGRLAAALAHELRNPLASISGSVEMLKESTTDNEERQKLMTIVLREIEGLNMLISELLNFVKPIRLRKKKFDLGGLLGDTVDLVKFEKKVAVEMHIEGTIVYEGDQVRLKQVFLNILKNSLDVLDEHSGKVIITVYKSATGGINVVFEDNGPGISEENIEKIFEPFFTTKDRGTGLGLATCHNVVVMHGGNIEVNSRPGKTEFRVIL